jgi:hypothetical protein
MTEVGGRIWCCRRDVEYSEGLLECSRAHQSAGGWVVVVFRLRDDVSVSAEIPCPHSERRSKNAQPALQTSQYRARKARNTCHNKDSILKNETKHRSRQQKAKCSDYNLLCANPKKTLIPAIKSGSGCIIWVSERTKARRPD